MPPRRLRQVVSRTTSSICRLRCVACGATSLRGTSRLPRLSQRGRLGLRAWVRSASESFPAPSTPSLSAHMPPPRSAVRVRIHSLGETAVLAELGTKLDTALNTRAIALAAALKKRRDVRQAVAGHASVTVQFNPEQVSHQAIAAAIRRLATRRPPVEEPGRLHRIPVVYDGADLEMVCSQLQISPARLVELHCRPIYRASVVGFVPGAAYLGPVPDELVLPRRAVPRTQVPAGGGGIAGPQTGSYPA